MADGMGMEVVRRSIGIAEAHATRDADKVLVTHALGSCIGVALFDPVAGAGGMVHCMLPLSKASPGRAKDNPYMFTDTGVATLLQEMFDLGASRGSIVAKVAGAATHVGGQDLFRIGERNYAVLRRVLWKNDILIAAEDVGGREYRTLMLEVASGRVLVKKDGGSYEL